MHFLVYDNCYQIDGYLYLHILIYTYIHMHILVYVMIPITEYSENYENGDSSTHIYSEFESKI
jgi:hypothetical protein